MNEADYQQVFFEREMRLVEALANARKNAATEEDWAIIYYECGVKNESDGIKPER
jgi:hypothetical protein